MADSCRQCPALHAEIARLNQHIAQLNRQVAQLERRLAYLRDLLQQLIGAVRGTVAFIDRELAEASMPRRQLIPAIHQRLTILLDQAEGTRV